MERSDHHLRRQPHDRGLRHCGRRRHAQRLARQTPLTEEVSGSEQRDDRLLALVREDVILTFPRWMKNHTQSPSRAIIVLAGDPGKMPDCLLVRSSEPVRWP